MSGYDFKFDKFDAMLPYHLVAKSSKKQEGFGRVDVSLQRKSDGKEIAKFERNYASLVYANRAFYQFKWKDRWLAFVSRKYNLAEIIDIESDKTLSVCNENSSWCPTNFYVPASLVDDKVSVLSLKDRVDAQGKARPAEDYYDHCHDWQLEDEDERKWSTDHIKYLNTAFMAGVFWAADYEWIVYRINIEKALETGKFGPEKDTYCFEFDYATDPEIRQFLKQQEDCITSLRPFDPNRGRFYYYSQKFVDMNWSEYSKWK